MNKAVTLSSGKDAQSHRFRLLSLRSGRAIPIAIIVALSLGSLMIRPRPVLLWNPSPSSSTGLYVVRGPRHIRVGDMVVAWPPPAVRGFAGRRRYLPIKVPLIKRVAAVDGDLVCARQRSIFVGGRIAAVRARRDPKGRLLPWWIGCRRLNRGEFLLLSPSAPLAFDGRYFGLTHSNEVIGKAKLLWES